MPSVVILAVMALQFEENAGTVTTVFHKSRFTRSYVLLVCLLR